jgi:O-antigen/teichoic acid export membrane protein
MPSERPAGTDERRTFAIAFAHTRRSLDHRLLAALGMTIHAFTRFLPDYHLNVVFADQALVSGGNFLGGILFARLLTLEEFGRLTLAWIVVECIASLQFAAIIQPMLNIGPKQLDEQTASYYGAVTFQQGVVGLVSGALVWAATLLVGRAFHFDMLAGFALPLAASVTASQYQNYARRYFFARERALAAFCNDSLRYATQLGCCVLLMTSLGGHGMTSATALWVVAGATAIAAIHGAIFLGPLAWDRAVIGCVIRRHWQFSRWLLPSAIMSWMTGQAFAVIAGVVLGAATVGALRAAQTLLGITHVLLLALENFAPVRAARSLNLGGISAFHSYLRRLAALTAILTAGIITALNSDPDFVIHIVFGSQYQGIGYIVRWISGNYFVYAMCTVLVTWAAAIEDTEAIFVSYAAATAVTVVLAYPLARYGGVTGVLLGALLVEIVRAVVLVLRLAGRKATPGLIDVRGQGAGMTAARGKRP